MKVSLYFGKRVESVKGKTGYVLSVLAEGKNVQCLVCADGDEREFTVDVKNIKSVKTKITFKDGETVQKSGTSLRLGKPVYDCEANYIGKLTDFTVENNTIVYAHVGSKKFSFDDIVLGDAVIIKSSARILKSDVKSKGKIIIRRGTSLTPEVLQKAQKHGEYVQANLRSI